LEITLQFSVSQCHRLARRDGLAALATGGVVGQTFIGDAIAGSAVGADEQHGSSFTGFAWNPKR
jgi:hypothetical protein